VAGQVRRDGEDGLGRAIADDQFDTFPDEDGRQAHLNGPIAAALGQAAPDLLAKDPDIQKTDILAAK